MKFITLVMVGFAGSAANGGATAEEKRIGVTWSGGGFRAHSVFSGVVSGLVGKTESDVEDLMKDVDIFGSNSGGSWFFSQLAYSNNFLEMLEEIGDNNTAAGAGEIYNEKWIRPFMFKTKVSNDRMLLSSNLTNLWELLKEAVKKFIKNIPAYIEWLEFFVKVIYETGLQWDEFVEHIISVPGDVDPTKPFVDMKPATWAKGKSWGMAGAVLTPDTTKSGFLGAQKCSNGRQLLSYASDFDLEEEASGKYHPITFSSVMGIKNGDTPMPFISKPKGVESFANTYEFDGQIIAKANETAPFFQGKSNDVKLVDAVATSSAFLGGAGTVLNVLFQYPIIDQLNQLLDLILVKMPLHITSQDKVSQGYENGKRLVSERATNCEQWSEKVAKNEVMTMIDGGYIDNLAISNVLSAANSPDSIVAFSNVGDNNVDEILNLFQPITPPKPSATYDIPIFEEDTAEAKAQIKKNLQKVDLPKGLKYLDGIQYGTITATTVDSPKWGIKGGKKVEIHLVITSTVLGIGALEWENYGVLVGEISNTLQTKANDNAAQTILSWLKK